MNDDQRTVEAGQVWLFGNGRVRVSKVTPQVVSYETLMSSGVPTGEGSISMSSWRALTEQGQAKMISDPLHTARDAVIEAARKVVLSASLGSCAYIVTPEEMHALRTALTALDAAKGNNA